MPKAHGRAEDDGRSEQLVGRELQDNDRHGARRSAERLGDRRLRERSDEGDDADPLPRCGCMRKLIEGPRGLSVQCRHRGQVDSDESAVGSDGPGRCGQGDVTRAVRRAEVAPRRCAADQEPGGRRHDMDPVTSLFLGHRAPASLDVTSRPPMAGRLLPMAGIDSLLARNRPKREPVSGLSLDPTSLSVPRRPARPTATSRRPGPTRS